MAIFRWMKLPVGQQSYVGYTGHTYRANDYGTILVSANDVLGCLSAGGSFSVAGPPTQRPGEAHSQVGDTWFNTLSNKPNFFGIHDRWIEADGTLSPINGSTNFAYPDQSGLLAAI